MSERSSSSSDWVERIMAALCFRQVLSASTTYRWMLGFFRNTQASSMKKALKTEEICRSRDDGVRAMQDVEEQRFEKFRVLAHLLEVETLEAGERNRVFGVVEEETELAASRPFGERLGKSMRRAYWRGRRECAARGRRSKDFRSVVEVALGGGVELAGAVPWSRTLTKSARKSRFSFVGGSENGLIVKSVGLEPDADVRAAEELREAFKAPAQDRR